ncbi:alpha-L-arabinofuranosidase C-terminal domain-containing protein, partial [Vibrio parahaemolyticus]
GPAWRQTTFFPFRDAARHARGRVVVPTVSAPRIDTERHGAVPAVDAVAPVDGDTLAVFAVHRGRVESTEVRLGLPAGSGVVAATVLTA